jgi:formylglycine-generating enzyme required for sulfatase activity
MALLFYPILSALLTIDFVILALPANNAIGWSVLILLASVLTLATPILTLLYTVFTLREGVVSDSSPRISRRNVLVGAGVIAGLAATGPITLVVRQLLKPPVILPTMTVTLPNSLASLGFVMQSSAAGAAYIAPPLCKVAAGPFLMGSDPARDSQAQSNELPQSRVTLGAFQIGKYPVTVAEYVAFLVSGHSVPVDWAFDTQEWTQQLTAPDHPIDVVTWDDAIAYAAWLTRVSGTVWRLATEAEWEKAARGMDGRIYPWGDPFDATKCNSADGGQGGTTHVGSYPTGASPYGAQDMAGNVWEWTSSLYRAYPYQADDGREDLNASGQRVQRGGQWDTVFYGVRAACRLEDSAGASADASGFGAGFRLVCAVSAS